jgi:hypothetical protein
MCYPYTRPYSPHKLSPRSKPYVLIGYSSLYKGYKCLDLHTNKIYIFKHVLFDENLFPFKELYISPSVPVVAHCNYPLQLLSFAQLPSPSLSAQDSTSILAPAIPHYSSPDPLPTLLSVSIIIQVYPRCCSTQRSPAIVAHPPSALPTSIKKHHHMLFHLI